MNFAEIYFTVLVPKRKFKIKFFSFKWKEILKLNQPANIANRHKFRFRFKLLKIKTVDLRGTHVCRSVMIWILFGTTFDQKNWEKNVFSQPAPLHPFKDPLKIILKRFNGFRCVKRSHAKHATKTIYYKHSLIQPPGYRTSSHKFKTWSASRFQFQDKWLWIDGSARKLFANFRNQLKNNFNGFDSTECN